MIVNPCSIASPIPLRQRRDQGARGFTLIELMVVVAIVAILAAIAFPSYQDSVRKSKRGQAKADLVELAQRAERFHTVNNTYVGFAIPSADAVSPRTAGAPVAYEVALAASTPNTFTLTATPTNAQVADVLCMTLSIDQLGQKGRTGNSSTVAECW